MAEPKTGPFEETELDILSTAQAVTCVHEDDGESHAAVRRQLLGTEMLRYMYSA